MTATTLDTTTTARRDYEISEALHTVADLYYRGSIPEAKYTDQPILVNVVIEDLETLGKFALDNGVETESFVSAAGLVITTAELTIAPNAVRVQLIHSSRSEPTFGSLDNDADGYEIDSADVA